jgi:hypothetical protein
VAKFERGSGRREARTRAIRPSRQPEGRNATKTRPKRTRSPGRELPADGRPDPSLPSRRPLPAATLHEAFSQR